MFLRSTSLQLDRFPLESKQQFWRNQVMYLPFLSHVVVASAFGKTQSSHDSHFASNPKEQSLVWYSI
jgi:hypothetical protein